MVVSLTLNCTQIENFCGQLISTISKLPIARGTEEIPKPTIEDARNFPEEASSIVVSDNFYDWQVFVIYNQQEYSNF